LPKHNIIHSLLVMAQLILINHLFHNLSQFFLLLTITLQSLTPKGRRSFFSNKCLNLPFLAQEAQTNKNNNFKIAILTIRSCLRLLWEHVQKAPVGTADFDRLLCKKFELRNFEILHHLNAHHVRYMCTKS
jgi:hypothetical protein